MASPVGARPGVLKEPEPQLVAVTAFVAAGALSSQRQCWRIQWLRSFLLRAALKKKKKEEKEEEEERRRLREVAEYETRMHALERRVNANEQLTRTESLAWAKWASHIP